MSSRSILVPIRFVGNFIRRALSLFCLLLLMLAGAAIAQGDGPRSQVQIPTHVNFLVPTYLNLTGNYNLNGNILLPGADINPNVFVLTYMRAWAIGDNYAQIWVNPIWGSYNGEATVTDSATGNQFELSQNTSGLGDTLVNFKIGLVGLEPLGPKELARHAPGFQLSAFASVSIPTGKYSDDELLNIGTNIWAFRVGTPMVVPFGSAPKLTYWEIFPSITFYGDNDDPATNANRIEQNPLFAFESHLSHNFTPRFWGSLDLRYRYGAQTTSDGIEDNNKQNVLGGGISAGYSLTPTMSIQGSYGQVLTSSDESELDMFRVKMAFLF